MRAKPPAFSLPSVLSLALAVFSGLAAHAGGPRFVAGTSYFNPGLAGQPVVWPGGAVTYFTDQGALSSSVSNAAAVETVAAAAAVWNTVPTAAISIQSGGSLAEDVNGGNVIAASSGVTMPADVQSTAISTPVGVVFDADGSVIDALFGTGASDPNDCIHSGVMNVVDNLASNGSIAHALLLVNGRCTGSAAQLEQLEFQMIRAFGRVLGLDWSQANDDVLSTTTLPSLQQLEGWPLMRPVDLYCGQLSTQCLPNPLQLRADDIAAVSRLYPVTAANQAQFPGKTVTETATISIRGSVYFRRSQGMQGVNVVARPISPGVLLPDDRYPVASVSGFLYTGNRGNPVNGVPASTSTAVSDSGSDDPLLEGFYDLSGIALPPGESIADYQLTLEPINSLYTGSIAVGPYASGSPTPSGTLPAITLHGLTAGSSTRQDFTIADSAGDLHVESGGPFAAPASLRSTGEWQGRVPAPGQTSWFAIPVQAGRHFTVESQAIDEAGAASEDKLRTVIGVWNGSDPDGSPAVAATVAPFNGAAPGVTALAVDAIGEGELLLAVADQRGDGRPDYTYRGRLLYAASVTPERLPLAGGQIRIAGSGFRPGMTVTLGTQIATTVTSITPEQIVATVPPNTMPTGSLDLVVHDPATNGYAAIAGGISYGAASADTLSITTLLPATLGEGASAPLTVRVFGPDQVTPVVGVPVTFAALLGTATFTGCGSGSGACSVTTSGDGYATASVIPGSAGLIRVQASLTTGAAVLAEFNSTTARLIVPVNSALLLAPGAAISWTAQVQVVSSGGPSAGVVIAWAGQSALAAQAGTSTTDAQGLASFAFSTGAWPAGTSAPVTACIQGTSTCASFTVFVVHPEVEGLVAVSGVDQHLRNGETPAAIVLRLIAPGGQPIVGGVVSATESDRSWTPACTTRSGTCPAGRLLSAGSQSAVSGLDGLVSFTPAILAGLPVTLSGEAQAGLASQRIRIEVAP